MLHAIRPDPGPAREWLERELSRPAYRQSLLDQLLSMLRELWTRLRTAALGASELSTWAVLAIAVVLVVLVAVVVTRLRREPVRAMRTDAVLVADRVTAAEHRSAAETAAARGDHDRAVVEAFRAVAVRAVDRGILDDRPGLTADELARELGPAFPGHATALVEASVAFDLVFYGDQPATAADSAALLGLEDALHRSRPAAAPAEPHRPSATVPR